MKNITKSSKKSNKTQKSKVFQPLIASSLALALGVSVSVLGADITVSSSQDINTDTTGNILLTPNSQTTFTVNFGTTQKVTLTGNIGNYTNHTNGATAGLTVNFLNGSTMAGDILSGMGQHNGQDSGNDFVTNTVTFSGGNVGDVVFRGNIISHGTGERNKGAPDTNNGNHVDFQSGSMVGNVEVALSSYDSTLEQRRYGYNEVSFSALGNQSLTGNITANGGINSINFSGSGDKKIKGDITSTGPVLQNQATVGKNTINSSNVNLILGENGVGSLYAQDSGHNLITASSLTFDLQQIRAGNGGYESKNLLEIGNLTLNHSLTIEANNTANSGSLKLNILKITGNVVVNNSAKISELRAVSVNSGSRSNTKNVLSFDSSSSNPITLTIGEINEKTEIETNRRATGYNIIGKSLTQGSAQGGDLGLVSGFENNWNSTTYQASNVTLNVDGDIYSARSGKNIINVGSLTVGGKIDGNGADNNIAVSGNLNIGGDLAGRWDGVNTIYVGGNATINNVYAEKDGGGATRSSGSNNITFLGSGAQLSSSGVISVGGVGNNTISIQGNLTVTSSLNTERTAGTGKNIFNIFNGNSMSFSANNALNTSSGQTEVVFKGDSTNSSGSFSGKVNTTGGTTTFAFSQDSGTYGISGELSANGAGQNIIDLSSKSATISTDLTLSGSPTGSGGNIIKIGDGKSLSFVDGRTNKTLSTTSGVSQVNFLNASGTFNGDLNTSGGTMTFSFQDNGTYGVSGDFATSGNGKNIFDLSSQSATISNDLTFSGSSVDVSAGNIINIGNGRSLTLSGGGGEVGRLLQTLDLAQLISMERQEILEERFPQQVE